MKSRIITAAAALLCCSGAWAQYFGVDFYKQGFDTEADLATWTVNTELAPGNADTKLWYLEESGFDEVDSTDKNSVCLYIPAEERFITTLTSPLIDTAGKTGLFAGLFGKNALSDNYNWVGIRVYFEVQAEGDTEWETIYESPDASNNTEAWNWKETHSQLASRYDGQKIRLRIRVRCDNEDGAGSERTLGFDGVYLSENYGKEAAVVALTPDADLYTLESATPVQITVRNNGSKSMTAFKVAYSVNSQPETVQDVVMMLKPGQTAIIPFDTKADFSTPGMSYTITGRVILDGDMVEDNDEMEVSFHNILTELPYAFEPSNNRDTDFWYSNRDQADEREHGDWYLNRDLYWTQQVYSRYQNWGRLYTRPLYLSEGQNLTASYTLWAQGSDGADAKAEVYLVQYDDRDDSSQGTLIKSYELTSNRLSDKVNITVPEEGVYSVMFYNKSEEGGKNTAVQGFKLSETPDYDGGLLKFVSPRANKDEFTAEESVTVTYANTGTKAMSGAQVRLSLDGNVAAVETLPDLAPGTQADYTFAAKLDMQNGSQHTLSVELLWEPDSDPANNTLSGTFTADLASPPYKVDSYGNDFETHWSWTDNNKDGISFGIENVYGNNRLGYNVDGAKVLTTDETVYARTLRLTAGKTYKINGRINIWPVNGEEQIFDVAIDLYKVDTEGNRTLYKAIAEKSPFSSSDGYYTLGFDVADDGKYAVAFRITRAGETTTHIAIADFNIEESGAVEAVLSSVNVPGTVLSGYGRLPYSVRITNNGLTPLATCKLKVQSETLGVITEDITFDEPLKPGAYANVHFTDKPLVLDITGDEVVSFELVAEGDVVPANNVQTLTFRYIAPASLPMESNMSRDAGWLCFDNDGNGRTPYYYSYNNSFSMSDGSPGDWVMSPAFKAEKDTPYRISYQAKLSGFSTSGKALDVYLVNTADGEKTYSGTLVFDKQTTPGGWSGFDAETYVTAPSDGVYVAVFEHQNMLEGYYASFNINGPVKVEAVTTAPDLTVSAITSPSEDAVFTNSESVTANYKNVGEVAVSGASFRLDCGDKAYFAYADGEIEAGSEGTVTFTGVDLYTPGEYTLKVTAINAADPTPENNTATLTLHSRYIYNVNVLSIDGPDNGPLGTHEHVSVSIKNEGHGALTDLPVTLTVSGTAYTSPVTVTETVAGPIEENQTLQYTFKAYTDFSQDAAYTVSVSVLLEGDTTPENNSVSATIVSTHEDMDAGVTAVTGPKDRRMTGEEYIVIKVKNYSAIDIYRVPVSATVSLGQEVKGTVSGTVAEIAAGAEVEYTFPTAVDMSCGGTYTVQASTSMPNDVNPDNDSYEGTLYAYIKDCGVSRIISPEAGGVEGRQSVTVEITNFGDVPMSDIPVNFKLGNNPQTDVWEGELAPGRSVEYTFKSQYNFRAGREYTLTAYTSHPEDENADNDACVAEIKPTSGIAGVYAGGAISIRGNEHGIVTGTEQPCGMVEVYDASGRCVASHVITDRETRIHTAPGIYLVRVASGEATASAKVHVR